MIYPWNQQHAEFLSYILNSLNEESIRYFILRNYEYLPERNTGKDIDIVIEPGSYKKVHDILIKTLNRFRIRYYQVTQFDKMRCWYMMDFSQSFGIHIDIIENEVYKGFEFFNFEVLYSNVIPFKFFFVLNPKMDTLMLIVQNVVAYKSLKDRYRQAIQSNYTSHKKDIDAEILDFWGEKCGMEVIEALENLDFDSIVANSRTLAKTAMWRIFYKRPFYTMKNIARFLAGKFYRIIICPVKFRRFIAVEAPDGTGKTTFIDSLILALRGYYVADERRFCVHHFRPEVFPNLGALGEKSGVMKQDTDFSNPHRAQPANICSSLVRMLYYWLDYMVGIPYILRKEVQYERYTIFDRYVYDFLVDPGRSRINLPKWVRMAFAKLVIEPQIVFILLADANVIYSRKQELTKDEIERQLLEYQKLGALGENMVFIDANNPVDKMVDDAIKVVFDRFLNKAF